ncbi:GGDEF domain-containing protein, partial [Candidatus Aerophobetes bacterium]|nr:GGDEF domain-containing protein [Candidatus Aerophobetes bacterium]
MELKLPDFLCPHVEEYKHFRKNTKENEKNCRKNDILKIQLAIENKKMGVLLFYGMKKNISEEKIKIIELFATQVSLAIANLRYIERMRNLAMSDKLTGLYNQGYFYKRMEEELSRASRRGSPLSLLFLDVDGMKKINDTHGHIIGDKVLRLVAEKIKQSIRKTDIAFRYGGDEFVV